MARSLSRAVLEMLACRRRRRCAHIVGYRRLGWRRAAAGRGRASAGSPTLRAGTAAPVGVVDPCRAAAAGSGGGGGGACAGAGGRQWKVTLETSGGRLDHQSHTAAALISLRSNWVELHRSWSRQTGAGVSQFQCQVAPAAHPSSPNDGHAAAALQPDVAVRLPLQQLQRGDGVLQRDGGL